MGPTFPSRRSRFVHKYSVKHFLTSPRPLPCKSTLRCLAKNWMTEHGSAIFSKLTRAGGQSGRTSFQKASSVWSFVIRARISLTGRPSRISAKKSSHSHNGVFPRGRHSWKISARAVGEWYDSRKTRRTNASFSFKGDVARMFICNLCCTSKKSKTRYMSSYSDGRMDSIVELCNFDIADRKTSSGNGTVTSRRYMSFASRFRDVSSNKFLKNWECLCKTYRTANISCPSHTNTKSSISGAQ